MEAKIIKYLKNVCFSLNWKFHNVFEPLGFVLLLPTTDPPPRPPAPPMFVSAQACLSGASCPRWRICGALLLHCLHWHAILFVGPADPGALICSEIVVPSLNPVDLVVIVFVYTLALLAVSNDMPIGALFSWMMSWLRLEYSAWGVQMELGSCLYAGLGADGCG